jgi:hypothetical protein
MNARLIESLRAEAVRRGLIHEETAIDAAMAFTLVRDMTYQRASDRQPETLIREWRGTCSGKHYLLRALFAELGLRSRLIACTTEAHPDPEAVHPRLRPILARGEGRIVDVHNYLLVEHPRGEMIVDATWPASYRKYGLVVNEEFILGQDQHIASSPTRIWEVPTGTDPQAFKDELLRQNFTPHELEVRDEYIRTLGELFAQG